MSHSVNQYYEVYEEEIRRARLPRKCDACCRTVAPGDYYADVRIIFEGTAETVTRCGACQQTHEHLRVLAPGDMWPDENLGCGLDYVEEWEAEPPEDVAALPLLSDREAGRLLEERWRKRLAAMRTRRAVERARREVRRA